MRPSTGARPLQGVLVTRSARSDLWGLGRVTTLLGLVLVLTGCQSQGLGTDPGPSATGPIGQPSPIVGSPTDQPSSSPRFPAGRVATRIVISSLRIDLPVMLQTAKYGAFPLCDVAMYLPELGQPGQGRATYIYAHAREGMFLPLLTASRINNGRGMVGDLVEVYTSDSYLFTYKIAEVHRHTRSLIDAFNARTDVVFLQTSEGPTSAYPKLQVVATFISAAPTDEPSAHPVPHPVTCR